MITAWRLVKKSREKEAFSGEGARRYGGRWNHRDTAVVYVSDSLSLAALELFVHLGPAHKGMRFSTFSIEIPENKNVGTLQKTKLPGNWRAEPPPAACKDVGTQWVERGRAAVLRVPSVIVPIQYNYVINLNHHQFENFRITQQSDFSFDPRMWK